MSQADDLISADEAVGGTVAGAWLVLARCEAAARRIPGLIEEGAP